ncbi:MAG: hypothetical protein JWO59_1046 [Chloroflexi bacterium]|jgi:hypothetical protein|nr:hypothetical protein [Chloroflexota bacterium]
MSEIAAALRVLALKGRDTCRLSPSGFAPAPNAGAIQGPTSEKLVGPCGVAGLTRREYGA